MSNLAQSKCDQLSHISFSPYTMRHSKTLSLETSLPPWPRTHLDPLTHIHRLVLCGWTPNSASAAGASTS